MNRDGVKEAGVKEAVVQEADAGAPEGAGGGRVRGKASFKSNFLVFLAAVVVVLLFFEFGLRVYYYASGREIAGSEFEVQEKALYKQLSDESDPQRFLYGRSERWSNDDVLGLVPKPGRDVNQVFVVDFNETHKARVKVYMDYFNSLGMASFDEVNKSSSGKLRIAVLGDSFALGDDVLPRFSFANLLPRLIPGSEVINYGMSGKGTSYMYVAYKKRAVEYSPDVVVMSVMVDDLSRNGAGEEQFRQPEVYVENGSLAIKDKRIGSYREFLNSYRPDFFECYSCKFVSYRIERMNYKQRCYDFGLETFELALQDMKRELGGKLVVAVFLSTPELDEGYGLSLEVYGRLKDVLERNGVAYLDGKTLFDSELPKYGSNITAEFYKKEVSGHFSEKGYAVFALGLKDLLKRQGLVNGSVVDAWKVAYSPETLSLFFVDESGRLLKTVAAYDVLSVEQK